MAFRASCLTLLKPTKGMVLRSQSSEMFRLRWASMSSPIHLRYSIETACSLCSEASSILFIANCEGKRMRTFCCGWISKKSMSRSNTERKEWRAVSLSVTISLSTHSLCFHSRPLWYRTVEAVLTCLSSLSFCWRRYHCRRCWWFDPQCRGS